MSRQPPPRLLLLAMYPLDRGLWGPTARITQMRDALARLVDLEVVSGFRRARAAGLARFATSGRLRGLRGIYVESSTTLPSPADLAFLGLARALRIPVLTYVRDAYQLFPDYFTVTGPKTWLSRHAFLPAIRLLMGVSSRVAFPSRGLARAVTSDPDPTLLPPGSRVGPLVPFDPASRSLLYVGSLRQAAQGGDILIEGVALARSRGHPVTLLHVARPGEELPGEAPQFLRLVRAEGDEIDQLLPSVVATVTPRHITPYNNLAVPTKLMEYLGYARPLIVTDATEQARIVADNRCGVVVPDTAEGIADGISQVVTADRGTLAAWGRAARVAAEANSWESRARRVLELMEAAS